jgi:hypothetical protein
LIDIDPFLKDAVTRDTIPDFASPGDHFSTAGGLQFDFGDNPRRLCSGHVLDFKGATLELDADRVTDDMLRTEMAPIMIGSEMGQCYEKRTAPEEAWAALSTHISVRNVKLVANYSKLAPRARALGVKQFAIAGVGIQGHDAQASGIVLSDFGAYGREASLVGLRVLTIASTNMRSTGAASSTRLTRILRPARSITSSSTLSPSRRPIKLRWG